MDAVFALLGGLAGAAVFSHFHEQIIPLLYGPTNIGPITLADWFGNRVAGALVLGGLFGCSIWLIGTLWGRKHHG